MAVDHGGVDELEALEAALTPEHLDPGGREAPIDVVVVRVDLARPVAVHRIAVGRIRERRRASRSEPVPPSPRRRLSTRSRRAGVSTRCRIPQQKMKSKRSASRSSSRASSLRYWTFESSRAWIARKPSPPSSSTSQRARTHSMYCSLSMATTLLCPPGLGEEGVEPVEAADVEHGETLEALRDRRKPVAMVARMSRRVDPLRPIERKGVKPVRDVVENRAGLEGSASIGSRSATWRSAEVSSANAEAVRAFNCAPLSSAGSGSP